MWRFSFLQRRKGLNLKRAITTDDPHFSSAGTIAIPFEGMISCPHCKRMHNGRIVVHQNERQAYNLLSRLNDLLQRAVGRRAAMSGITDHKKWQGLTKPV